MKNKMRRQYRRKIRRRGYIQIIDDAAQAQTGEEFNYEGHDDLAQTKS